MAKLTAHGNEAGTIDYLTYRIRYMSDRQVLKNQGDGWKLYRKVKSDIQPIDAYIHARNKLNEFKANYPHNSNFMEALHETCGLYGRWYILETIRSMPNDPDGVWSTFDDSYDYKLPKLTIEECVELCKLYNLAELEAEENNKVMQSQ
jgi:hypothetical protein